MTLALLAAWTIRSSIVLGTALGLSAALRRQSAAARHWVLAVGIASALIAPLMAPVAPHWSLAAVVATADTAQTAAPASGTDVTVAVGMVNAAGATLPPSSPAHRTGNQFLGAALLVSWSAGVGLFAVALGLGLLRVASIARHSIPLRDQRWVRAAREVGAGRPALRRLVLLEGDSDAPLITWGIRPRVLLPAGARHWSDERIAIVLSHETAHIVRRDWMVLIAAELLRCVFWFNPLTWLAVNRLRLESERACDDLVLAQGVRASDYAQHLVDVARAMSRTQAWTPLPAMARASSLERRVSAMLDEQVSRRPLTRIARHAAAIPLLAMTISVAGFAAQSQFASIAGTIRDQLGGTIPRITITLVNTQNGAKHEIKTDSNGAYEIVGVPAGDYTLSTYAVGFKNSEATLQIAAGQALRRDMSLDVGRLQETIMVTDGSTPPGPPRQSALALNPQETCEAQPNSGGIKPPVKLKDVLKDVKPIYPASMKGSELEGKVNLTAIIGIDGAVKSIQTIDATNPDFESAAQEAVRQWRFTSTLLNCVPVEVEMNVAIAFRPAAAP
jgi:TonB family protein